MIMYTILNIVFLKYNITQNMVKLYKYRYNNLKIGESYARIRKI